MCPKIIKKCPIFKEKYTFFRKICSKGIPYSSFLYSIFEFPYVVKIPVTRICIPYSSFIPLSSIPYSSLYCNHTLVLPFSMPGKAAVSALLNSPLGLWVSLKIKDFKYILHDLVSKINIKFLKKNIFIEKKGKFLCTSL